MESVNTPRKRPEILYNSQYETGFGLLTIDLRSKLYLVHNTHFFPEILGAYIHDLYGIPKPEERIYRRYLKAHPDGHEVSSNLRKLRDQYPPLFKLLEDLTDQIEAEGPRAIPDMGDELTGEDAKRYFIYSDAINHLGDITSEADLSVFCSTDTPHA